MKASLKKSVITKVSKYQNKTRNSNNLKHKIFYTFFQHIECRAVEPPKQVNLSTDVQICQQPVKKSLKYFLLIRHNLVIT